MSRSVEGGGGGGGRGEEGEGVGGGGGGGGGEAPLRDQCWSHLPAIIYYMVTLFPRDPLSRLFIYICGIYWLC